MPTHMKAMVLEAPSQLAARNVEVPTLEPGQTMIRLSNSGICGTDRKLFEGSIPVRHPLIMGHEMVGEIVEGLSCDGAGAGTKVVVDPWIPCGNCFHCRVGQGQICPNGSGMGFNVDGGFAEYTTAPQSHVYSLPNAIDIRDAALIQVLTTCVHAQRRTPVFPGEVVVVSGLGVTGQLHVQLAKARGAGTVIGISRNGWKRELAQELGADIVVEPAAAQETVLEATDGRGSDLTIETSGVIRVLAEVMDFTRIGGRLMMFAIYTAKEGALPFFQFYHKELDVINARGAKGEDFPASIDFVRRGAVKLSPLITHVLKLDALDQALEMLVTDQSDRMKVILEH